VEAPVGSNPSTRGEYAAIEKYVTLPPVLPLSLCKDVQAGDGDTTPRKDFREWQDRITEHG
jgi:hypothetical protein